MDRQGLPAVLHPQVCLRQHPRLWGRRKYPCWYHWRRSHWHTVLHGEKHKPYAVVPAGVRGAQLSWFAHDAINSPPEKTQREYRRACASEHLHPGLRLELPLLIGCDDQRLLAGQVVRLCGDVPLAIEEQHPQKPAGSIEQMHRDDANRAGAEKGRASRGRPGGVIARTAGPPNAKLRPRRGRRQVRTSRDCLSPEHPLGQSEFLPSFEALAFPESAAGSSWLAY